MRHPFLLSVVALGAAGCYVPLTAGRLDPTPIAGQGNAPLKAQARRAAVSDDLLSSGATLERESRIAVEMDFFNADPRRPMTIRSRRLVLRDALGGPELVGRPVIAGEGGLPDLVGRDDSAIEPPPLVLRPGEARTVWVVYAGFPPDGPRSPLRATIQVEVEGAAPLELVVADAVPGAPRWRSSHRILGLYLGGGVGGFEVGGTSGRSDIALAPINLDLLGSRGRFIFGLGLRYEFLYREALAGGPPSTGASALVTVGWLPWRFPVGLYGTAGVFAGVERPPTAYLQADRSVARDLYLPRLGAGLVLQGGNRLAASGPFPLEQALSPLRRFFLRVGYAHWFDLGAAAGAGGLELSVGGAIAP